MVIIFVWFRVMTYFRLLPSFVFITGFLSHKSKQMHCSRPESHDLKVLTCSRISRLFSSYDSSMSMGIISPEYPQHKCKASSHLRSVLEARSCTSPLNPFRLEEYLPLVFLPVPSPSSSVIPISRRVSCSLECPTGIKCTTLHPSFSYSPHPISRVTSPPHNT